MIIDDIKGVIEINGTKFDAKDVLRAISKQWKISYEDELLAIGKITIAPSENPLHMDGYCQVAECCKIYEKYHSQRTKGNYMDLKPPSTHNSLNENVDLGLDGYDSIRYGQKETRTTEERISIDDSELTYIDIGREKNIPNGYQNSPKTTMNNVNYFKEQNIIDYGNDIIPTPKDMNSIRFITLSGPNGRIDVEKIPYKNRTGCIKCGSVVDSRWKYCPVCGNLSR